MNENQTTETYEVGFLHDTTESRSVTTESWKDSFGQLNRPGGLPARVQYYTDTGSIISEHWYVDGQLHRANDLPARIEYRESTGERLLEEWYLNGKAHRDEGKPASVIRSEESNEILVHLDFVIHGSTHRDGDLPAVISNYHDGSPKQRSFFKHGIMHRDPTLGPARIFFDEEGNQITREYRVNGTQVPIQETYSVPSP